jgi:hypothetical protein
MNSLYKINGSTYYAKSNLENFTPYQEKFTSNAFKFEKFVSTAVELEYNNNKMAIVFLTVAPSSTFFELITSIKRDDYDFFVVIDDKQHVIPEYNKHKISIIQYDDLETEEVETCGFKGSVLYFQNRACSRDKALFYFSNKNTKYQHIWFIEDDVFIPNIETITNIDTQYPSADLLVSAHVIEHNANPHGWHWHLIVDKISEPRASSMICAIRVSKLLLSKINEYSKVSKKLFLDEALFNTLALQYNLSVVTPVELETIVFRKDWTIDEIVPTNLYHPIKDVDQQVEFRKLLSER